MAIVKETKNSLRWFLIIVGGYGLLSVTSIAPAFKLSTITGVEYLISFILAVITLYIGIRFTSLLQTNPKFIVNFFWVELAYSVIVVVYSLAIKQFNILSLVFVGINTLILIAIINNVKRLAQESTLPPQNFISGQR